MAKRRMNDGSKKPSKNTPPPQNEGMKLTRIRLNDYYQFKDVEIDLTYPAGHEKEGQPLEKVCFLGQSGTGKTTLLRLIKWFVSLKRDIGKNISLQVPPVSGAIEMDFRFFDLSYQMVNGESEPFLRYEWEDSIDVDWFFSQLGQYYKRAKPVLLNFPTELLWGKNPPEPDIKETIDDELEKIKSSPKSPGLTGDRTVIDFAFEEVARHWEYILEDIRSHRARELLFKKKLAEAALKESEPNRAQKETKKQAAEYKKWLAGNPSPLDSLAEKCLDPLLFHLGLKVKRDMDQESVQNLGFISLQTLSGQDVPFDFWSTGTRQLVQTVIPLFQLQPKHSVLLADEPERSLYPDIQRHIIDTYVNLAPGTQFFFATHSPIITSAFEPWEIVELKFDKEHKYVYRECYYEGDNHVDNYLYYPEYMRWDSILQRIFDLDEGGGDKRIEALKRLTEMEAQIEKLKETSGLDSAGGKLLVEDYLALNRKLGWRTKDGDS